MRVYNTLNRLSNKPAKVKKNIRFVCTRAKLARTRRIGHIAVVPIDKLTSTTSVFHSFALNLDKWNRNVFSLKSVRRIFNWEEKKSLT